MSLAERRWLRLFTLCVLYVAQGIPWGFMSTTLPGYLTEKHVDPERIATVLAFTTLPYAFKWVWGPIIDTLQIPRFGRRRPWIILAQAMMALTLIALVTFDLGTEVRLLAWIVFIHTVFNSLQDVSVDAYAVEALEENERGRANGLMYGSKYVGGILGGAGAASLIAWTNLNTAIVVQTAVLGAIMILPLLLEEPAAPVVAKERDHGLANALLQAFSLRSTIVAVLLMLGMNFAIGVIGTMGFNLFINKLHWTNAELARLSGGWGFVVGGSCAAATGFLCDHFGRKPVAAVASIALAAGWFTFSSLSQYWHSHTFVYVAGFYDAAWSAIMSVALITLCMDLSWPRVAGSQFAAYMALSNFSTTLGYQYGAKLNAWLSFRGVYIAMALTQLAITLLLLPIDPKETRTKLPLPSGRPNTLAIVTLVLLVAFLGYMTIQKVS
ncbi:MAG TPA: MFS transporter [Kofleriaceae bacterium]|nr:MFS transporter [Kofleriaceae bacterium]